MRFSGKANPVARYQQTHPTGLLREGAVGCRKSRSLRSFIRFAPRVAELLHDLHYRECQEETLGVVAHCGRPPLAGHCAGGLFASHHTDIQKVFARSATVLANCAGRARR